MEASAVGVRKVRINNEQSYEWGTVESKFSKTKKYACIDYYWYGPVWKRVIESMHAAGMRAGQISFYKGAQIDEVTKTVRVRGDFIREVVADKHRSFWRNFFKCGENYEPKFITIGKIVKLPNISGDSDSLNFFVDGVNVNQMMLEPEDAEWSE